MDPLTQAYREVLQSKQQPPCLSVYQPTHRHFPDNQQDPIRFKNAIKKLERSLLQKHPAGQAEPLLAPLYELAENRDFWTHTRDGLAVFSAADFFRVYRLQRAVPEITVVSDSFHTKPLLRILQSADRYQVLGLNRKEIKLFEGNRDQLDEIELDPNVPRTIQEALGEELTDAYLTHAPRRGGANVPQHHGHGSKKDEVDLDAERFFREVDRAIYEHHSRPSGLMLLLAALPEHHNLFRRVSHNPQLADAALDVHPDSLNAEELRERAWRVVEPQYLARLASFIEQFKGALGTGLSSAEIPKIAAAAAEGRIATLLIDADTHIPGKIDPPSGQVQPGQLDDPDADDVLDDLGELVLKQGGETIIVPANRMPTKTGAAAIYRY